MAAFDTTRPSFDAASVAGVFFRPFYRLVAMVVAWNDARVTRNALSALSDRELEDIGLSRGDIDEVAAQAFH